MSHRMEENTETSSAADSGGADQPPVIDRLNREVLDAEHGRDLNDYLEYYHLLRDPTRFGIVYALLEADEPLTYSDLSRELGREGNKLNNHLRELRHGGLIIRRADFGDDDRTRHYHLSDIAERLVEPLLELIKSERAGIEEGFETC